MARSVSPHNLVTLPGGRVTSSRLNRYTVRSHTVTPVALAHALDIDVSKILALAEAGYLCYLPYPPEKDKKDHGRIGRITKIHVPSRVVDRAGLMLWMLGLYPDTVIPDFCHHAEIEIMRIARLGEPMRTEQAVRLLRRYRDAESIVEAVAKIRSEDVAAVEIGRLRAKYKRRINRLAGLTDMGREESVRATAQTPAQTPTPARSQSRSRPPSSARSPKA